MEISPESLRPAVRPILTCLFLSLFFSAATAEAADLTRRRAEPVIISGSRLPAFDGVPVERIVAYVKRPGEWVEIPHQVDERSTQNLKFNLPTACQYTHDPCELAYVLNGLEGNGLDQNDEFVFVARDASSTTASSGSWVGVPGTDTLTTRYRVAVNDTVNNETAYVYLYAWLRAPDHQPGIADYVRWDLPGTGACNAAGDPSCGWLRSGDSGSISDRPRLNLFFAGNWSAEAACIKPYSDDTTCAVSDVTHNLLDLSKWATELPLETEHGWDAACRAFLGVKDGSVRVIRRTQGAQSGRYTTKTEKFYGTWLEQIVNLRVHSIGAITMTLDHTTTNPGNPGAESPSLLFTRTYSAANGSTRADVIDASLSATPAGAWDDWIQIDFSRGTYVSWIDQPREFPSAVRTFNYADSSSGGGSNENQTPIRFGQAGTRFAGTSCLPSSEDLTCNPSDPESPSLAFRRFVRTLVPLAVDTPSPPTSIYKSEEGEELQNYRAAPLSVAPAPEIFNADPLPSPVFPCSPTLVGSTTDSGETASLELTLNGCDPSWVSARLYRGTTPGIYGFIADVGPTATYSDAQASPGKTYRYIARARTNTGVLGPASAEVVLSPTDTTLPPSPANVTAFSPVPSTIVAQWTETLSKDVSGFFAKSATTHGGPYSKLNLAPIGPCDGNQIVVLNLQHGQTYYLVVTAVDAAGNESLPSVEVSVTP